MAIEKLPEIALTDKQEADVKIARAMMGDGAALLHEVYSEHMPSLLQVEYGSYSKWDIWVITKDENDPYYGSFRLLIGPPWVMRVHDFIHWSVWYPKALDFRISVGLSVGLAVSEFFYQGPQVLLLIPALGYSLQRFWYFLNSKKHGAKGKKTT